MGRGQWSLTQLSASLQNYFTSYSGLVKAEPDLIVVPRPKPAAQQQREERVDMGSIPLDTSEAKNMTRSGASVAKYSIKLEIYAPYPLFPVIFVLPEYSGAKSFQIIKVQHLH